jgi:hypothetical protein
MGTPSIFHLSQVVDSPFASTLACVTVFLLIQMIGMNIGDQNEIGLGEPIEVSLAPRIDVNRLTARLNQHAGMPDDGNFHRSGTGLELFYGPRCLRKQNNAGQQQSANNLHNVSPFIESGPL